MAVVQYTFTQKQYTEQHNNFGGVRAVPRLGELYPGICLTTEEKSMFVLLLLLLLLLLLYCWLIVSGSKGHTQANIYKKNLKCYCI